MPTNTSVVTQITGQAWIRGNDGSLTPIYQGMQIPADANIVTAEGAAVQLQANGVPSLTIGENRDLQIGAEMAQTDIDPNVNAAMPADPDAARILAVLEAGGDPFDELDPTAAVLQGGDDGAGGSSFTRLMSIVETTTPLGLEYPRPSFPTVEEVRLGGTGAPDESEEPIVVPPPRVIIDDLNEIEPGHITISEDAGDEPVPGTFTILAPAGLSSLTVAGQTISATQLSNLDPDSEITIDTPRGSITLTGYDASTGIVTYEYRVDGAQDHSDGDVSDDIPVGVTDLLGRTTSDVLGVNILDTVPEAILDADSVTEDVTLEATGNVLDNDKLGVDDVEVVGAGVGDSAGAHLSDGVGTTLIGTYGSIVIDALGVYTYTLDNDSEIVQALEDGQIESDVFTYTIRDADGDLSTTTITIEVHGQADTATVVIPPVAGDVDNPSAIVYESGLRAPDDADTSNITTGTFTVTASDGIVSIVVGDGANAHTFAVDAAGTGLVGMTQPVTTAMGTIEITGYTPSGDGTSAEVTYRYTLDEVQTHTQPGADIVQDTVTVGVAGLGGSSESGVITIDIVDDVPMAHADTNAVIEGGSIGGNVLTDGTADVFGADGADAGGGVVGVRAAGGDTTTQASGNLGGTGVTGTYGTLVLNADGSYTYQSTANVVPASGATDVFVYTIKDGDGDPSTTTLTINVSNVTGTPVVTTGGLVHESGLPAGTESGTDKATVDGALTLQSGWSAVASSGTTALGTFTVNADGTYSYTLTQATTDVAGVDETDSFSYTTTDANGNTVTNTVTVTIVDDVPKVTADSGSVTEGATLTVDAAGGVLFNDLSGADGWASGGGVVGVMAGSDTSAGTENASVGVAINGQYGTLTLNADGSYTYVSTADAITADLADTFVYTVKDGDGDVTSTTLTINVSNVTGTPVVTTGGLVHESGLPAGTESGTDKATVDGALTLQSGWSAVASSGTTALGTFTVNADGTYSYTLTQATTDVAGVDETDSFSYTTTDANGNTVTNTVTVTIVDDVPKVTADSGSVTEGATLTVDAAGGVLFNDLSGADGWASGGGVVGVMAGSDTSAGTENASVGVAINGQYGTLTLNADGSYTYVSTADAITADLADTFVYTVKDGDGDVTSTTLTINVSNVTGTPVVTTGGLVHESGLPAGTESGTDKATVDGALTLQSGWSAVASSGTTALGTFTVNADGTYSYTLTQATTDVAGVDETDSFSYTTTDANGNTVTNTVTVTIVDDVPKVTADSGSVTEGATLTVDAAGGVLFNDLSGADGWASGGGVVGVMAGSDTSAGTENASVGVAINGQYGTLTLNADGSYTYVSTADAITADLADTFVYTVKDGDGDVTSTTLTINVSNVTGTPVVTTGGLVHESGLPAGTESGTDKATVDGALTLQSGWSAVASSGTTALGTFTVNADGTYSYTLTQATTDVAGVDETDSFSYTTTDANGNTVTNTVTVTIVDDVPKVTADSGSVTEGATLTVDAAGGVLFNDLSGADGWASGGGVVGVMAGSDTSAGTENASVGVAINGQYGTLTLNADGSYTYVSTADAITADLADTFVYTVKDGDGDVTSTTLTINVSNVTGTPVVTTGGLVHESGLPAGTESGTDKATVDGALTLQSGWSAVASSGTTALGTFTVNADGTYSYTLTQATTDVAGVDETDSFSYTTTDANGNTVTNTVTVTIVDDVPKVTADSGSVTEGATLTVDAAGGVLFNDLSGADGWASGGGVVGVMAGSDTSAGTENASVGVAINGQYGTLTLNADGSYTYVSTADAITADLADTFVYTVKDGDGDVTSTTLTINVSNVTGTPVVTTGGLVHESGLPAGTESGTDKATVDGALTLQSGWSAVASSGTTALGTFTVNADGTYSYTLTQATTDVAGVDETDSFSYTTTDANGNTVTNTVTVTIVDDVPKVTADSGSVTEGATLTVDAAGGVLFNDLSGADGWASGGGVVGVMAGSDTSAGTENASVGVAINGQYGTLTLNADGSYTYVSTADAITADLADTFVYTVKDGDGDVTSTTLTINVSNVTGTPVVTTGGLVHESGLPAGTESGTDKATVDGALTLQSGWSAVASSGTTALGTFTVNADGTYSYTLTQATTDVAGVDETDSFSYTTTDANGNTVTNTVTVTIVDDVPKVTADSGSVTEGATLTVDAAGGVLFNDLSGADGWASGGGVVGVMAGSDTSAGTENASVGVAINGQYGTLTLNADGSYTYVSTADAITADLADTFVYTVKDGDGDVTSTTLTINVSNVTGTPVVTTGGLVHESGLPAGTESGTDKATVDGALTLQSGWSAVASSGTTALGTFTVNADGTYSYTLTQATTDVAGVDETDSFSYTTTDANGNTVTNTVTVTIVDDVPKVTADSGSVTEGATLTVDAAGGVLFNDLSGADGWASGGGVVGVMAGSDTSAGTENASVGVAINGQYGTLTLNADGSYTYVSTADAITADLADTFVYTVKDGDGDVTSTTLTINVSNVTGTPVVTTGGLVHESGLPAGTESGTDKATVDGALTLQSGWSAVASSGTTALGTFTVNADGTYSYTLTQATTDVAGVDETDSFSYTTTDANGNTVTNTVTVTIVDDVPKVTADSGSVTEGATLTVDAAGGVLFNDLSGADGWASGGGVVGVMAGSDTSAGTENASVGVAINGQYGTLTLNADGSYTYVSTADAITADLADTFVYTVKDGDGDVTSTTLTINVSNVTGTPVVTTGGLVHESGLPAGTESGTDKATVDGALTLQSGWSAVASSGTTALGTFTVNADGTYSYTLTQATTDVAGVDETDSFSYTTTDANGNTVTNTVTVTIVDDVPKVTADSGSVTEGATLTVDAAGGVLFNDLSGADGWASGGGVVGVMAGSDTSAGTENASVGVAINGQYGTLTLNADGSYTYVSTADAITADLADTFVYTVKDGDGDVTSTTLTINVSNVTGTPVVTTGGLVHESGLPAGTESGTDKATVDGALTLQSGWSAVASSGTTALGTFTVNADGTYSYTLTQATTDVAGVDETDSFSYTTTDANGNTVTNTVTVTIVDDVPKVTADSGSVTEGATLTVDAAGGVLFNDLSGADGWASGGGVVGVMAGSDTSAGTENASVGVAINGQYGTLTLNADGSYTYVSTADAITADLADTFVYTVKDGDGDVTSTTLTINVADVILEADNQSGTVYEAALDTSTTGDDLGHGTVTGSNPASPDETVIGQLAVAGTGVTYTPISQTTAYGIFELNSDGGWTYTLTAPYTTSPAANDGNNTEMGKESFTYTATDVGGNTVTGTVKIDIVDDVPSAQPDNKDITISVSTVNVANFEAGFTNITNTSGSGSLGKYNLDSDAYFDKITWGYNTSNPSGYVLVDNEALRSSGQNLIDTKFLLGTFTHNNFPISGNSKILDTTDLVVKFTVMIDGQPTQITHTVELDHNETPNNYYPDSDPRNDDIITLGSSGLLQTFTVGDRTFEFEILGFRNPDNSIVTQIKTQENKASSFELYAVIRSTDDLPEITGSVGGAYAFGADGPGTGGPVHWEGAVYNAVDQTYTIATTAGTFIGKADGSYTFNLSREKRDNFDVGDQEDLTFTYTVTDADGDTASAVVTISLTGEPNTPFAPVNTQDFVPVALESGEGLMSTTVLGVDQDTDDEESPDRLSVTEDSDDVVSDIAMVMGSTTDGSPIDDTDGDDATGEDSSVVESDEGTVNVDDDTLTGDADESDSEEDGLDTADDADVSADLAPDDGESDALIDDADNDIVFGDSDGDALAGDAHELDSEVDDQETGDDPVVYYPGMDSDDAEDAGQTDAGVLHLAELLPDESDPDSTGGDLDSYFDASSEGSDSASSASNDGEPAEQRAGDESRVDQSQNGDAHHDFQDHAGDPSVIIASIIDHGKVTGDSST